MSPQTNPIQQWRRIFVSHKMLLITLLVCGLSTACSKAANTNQTNNNSQASSAASPTPSAAPSGLEAKASAEDKGAFKLSYQPVKDQDLAHIEKVVEESKLFERLV